MRVAVIGGGVAGTAAAWAARRAGADVTVSIDRAGATSLYSGALDVEPWAEESRDQPLESDLLAFATALEAWSVGTQSARVATYEGVVRPARGLDSALLDLTPLAGAVVAVASVAVDGWDAAALARALGSSSWAQSTKTRFEPVSIPPLLDPPEALAPAFDIARLHEAPESVARLADGLASARLKPDAWLLGPWLGTVPGVAERLVGLMGKPCGETTSPPGGPAGARFEASRDALFSSLGVHLRNEHVKSVSRRGSRFFPMGIPDGRLTANDAGFDGVIVASGGILAGGIVLERGSSSAAPSFVSAIDAGFEIGVGGRFLDHFSSVHGVVLPSFGMRVLERLGILAEASVARGGCGVFVAGDCVADEPRTVLAAALSGITAARRTLAR